MQDDSHWIIRIYDKLGAGGGDCLVMAGCVIAVAVLAILAYTGNL